MPERFDRLSAALADRYRIERELGAGGMATVYLAEDLKHHRKVAVKVLRPELAVVLGGDRFVKEIETTANLQHPNILPLFDSGEAAGFLYYVMPFIDGDSLRDKLNRETQLGVDEAVRITTEVADALDYAHRQNVIHRDIKPENILLQDGRPVVADFGIALAVSAAAGGRMTETGLSLGTPHYMSPEQATAEKELTNRSDIYSLGCVLYEMLTGDPPHTGSSVQTIIKKIVIDEPRPITELRKSIPANVAAATDKALQKLAADRFETAAKFSEALTNPSFRVHTATASVKTDVSRRAVTINRVSYIVIALLAIATIWGWWPQPSPPVTRVSVRFPDDQVRTAEGNFDLSLDGQLLVYNGPGSDVGQTQLWARRWDALRANAIPNTNGVVGFTLSPDGDEVAFTLDSSIVVVVVESGLSRTVAPDSASCCARWSRDGEWIYFNNWSNGQSRVPAAGGPVEVMTVADTTNHQWMEVLPGSRGAVFQASELFSLNSRIMTLDLESREVRELLPGLAPRYGGGRLWFADQGGRTLMTVPFDIARMEVTGPATPVAELTRLPATPPPMPYYAVSQSGTLVYSTGGGEPERTAVWVSRDGVVRPVDPAWRGVTSVPALSPDGTQLAISGCIRLDFCAVYVKQLDDGPLIRLPGAFALNIRPSWTPDGESVLFISASVPTDPGVYSVRADGSGNAERMPGIPAAEARWSRDGRWLVYRTSNSAADLGNIMAIRPGVDTVPVPLVETAFAEAQPVLSPDGQWLAYSSNRSGRREVYVRPFPNAGDYRVPISIAGGTSPVWANTSPELFYRSTTDTMIAVTFATTPRFHVESRTPLFDTRRFAGSPENFPAGASFDIGPDDQRFIMVQLPDASVADTRELILVVNQFEELRTKAGN